MIEYEKKFLLRKLDFGDLANSGMTFSQTAILQGYVPEEISENEVRYRITLIPHGNSIGMSIEYTKTIKKDTDSSVTREEEVKEISQEEFKEGFDMCDKFVDKVRYKIDTNEGYELIVDDFHESMARLTMCEIEILRNSKEKDIVSRLNNIELPDFIQREVIMDVTEFPQFKNSNLAIPITNQNKEELRI